MEFLQRRGWQVLEHRFRMGRAEVDLVVRKGALVAFVEVKTRRSARFGKPVEAVGWAKQRELHRVASAWVDRFGLPGDVYRFDVIGVMLSDQRSKVEHIKDAFWPGWR
jgi:putative endonuclease